MKKKGIITVLILGGCLQGSRAIAEELPARLERVGASGGLDGYGTLPDRRVNATFDETPFGEVRLEIERAWGIALLPGEGVDFERLDPLPITLHIEGLPLADALIALAAAVDDGTGSIRWSAAGDRVVLERRAAAGEEPGAASLYYRTYDVRALTLVLTDHIGPAPIPGRDDRTSGAFEEPREIEWTPDDIQILIEEQVQPYFWINADGDSINVTPAGMIVVRATSEVHRGVARLLEGIREQRGLMAAQDVRLVGLPDSIFRERFGDALLLDENCIATLDALIDDGTARVLAAGELRCVNTQRAYFHSGETIEYVRDYTPVPVAEGDPRGDPEIAMLRTGLLFDARPVMSSDRTGMTLELRADWIEVLEMRDVQTPYGAVQTHRMRSHTFRGTETVPDGRTAILGQATYTLPDGTLERVLLVVRPTLLRIRVTGER